MDGVGRVRMTLSQLGRRYLWPVGVRFYYWARWARVFIEKYIYYSRYNAFTQFLPFPMARGSQMPFHLILVDKVISHLLLSFSFPRVSYM
jgi:hypothetical protein